MSEEILVRCCSPTLAGIKTGSLFTLRYDCPGQLAAALRGWNAQLGEKGLRALPLRWRDHRALVYLYRPEMLCRDLNNAQARALLTRLGYDAGDTALCLRELGRRLRRQGEFPHEIGLFLGYPPEDVRGFMRDACGEKCRGCWKVYGDVESARRTFARYKKCTDIYCRLYCQGRSLAQLAVAG